MSTGKYKRKNILYCTTALVLASVSFCVKSEVWVFIPEQMYNMVSCKYRSLLNVFFLTVIHLFYIKFCTRILTLKKNNSVCCPCHQYIISSSFHFASQLGLRHHQVCVQIWVWILAKYVSFVAFYILIILNPKLERWRRG